MEKDKIKILIANRSSAVRSAMRNSLAAHGYSSILSVDSGKRMLELLRDQRVSLAIIDSELGDMDGLEAATLLRDSSTFGDVPLVYCSRKAGVENNSDALALGLEALLIKPFTAQVFVEVVVPVLDRIHGEGPVPAEEPQAGRECPESECCDGEQKDDPCAADREAFKGLSVLAVDDSASMLHVLRDYLARMGFTNVIAAKNGEEAWAILKRGQQFDLIISDWRMPHMSGIELLVNVRKSPGNASIPFVLVTSEANTDSILMAGKHSATGYIVKPFGFAEFTKTIRQIFAGKTGR
ncbi:MAG: response regulator [Acidobacteriota bacterium]